jgi:hypothetical protein
MKTCVKLFAIAAAAALLTVSAQAASRSFVTSGTATGGTPGFGGSWTVVTPSTTSVTMTFTLQIPAGDTGGGGGGVSLNGQGIASIGGGGSGPLTITDSDSASNQPSGSYHVSQSWGGSPGV